MSDLVKALKSVIPAPVLRFLFHKVPYVANKLTVIFWKSMVKPGDIVIQGGADMGWKQKKLGASNVFKISNIVGPQGKVYAIEPDKENYRQLVLAVEKEGFQNIIPIHKAIWSHETSMTFRVGRRSNDSQLGEYLSDVDVNIDEHWTDEVYEVSCVTLDQIWEEYGLEKLDFVCLTINGAEYEGLLGADKILTGLSPKLYIAASHPVVRPKISDEPYSDAITALLKRYEYNVIKDSNGWLVAEKVKQDRR